MLYKTLKVNVLKLNEWIPIDKYLKIVCNKANIYLCMFNLIFLLLNNFKLKAFKRDFVIYRKAFQL